MVVMVDLFDTELSSVSLLFSFIKSWSIVEKSWNSKSIALLTYAILNAKTF